MPSQFCLLKCDISSDIPDRASVMFGVFLGFGNMIFSITRSYSPSLFFFSIFGTIAVDIFCVCVSLISIHSQPPINMLSVCRPTLPFCKLPNSQQCSHLCICLFRNGTPLLFCFISGDRESRIPWLVVHNSRQGESNAHVAREFIIT